MLHAAAMDNTASLRITDGLRYLAGEFGATRDEFRRDNQPHGDALLLACESLGYVGRGKTPETRDRVSLTPAGMRRLADVEPAADE